MIRFLLPLSAGVIFGQITAALLFLNQTFYRGLTDAILIFVLFCGVYFYFKRE